MAQSMNDPLFGKRAVAVEAPAYYGLLELLSEAGARVLPMPVTSGEGIDPVLRLNELPARFMRHGGRLEARARSRRSSGM